MTEMSPAPATIAELKQAFPDDSDFVLSCVEGEMTMLEAEAAYGKKLRVELEKRNLRISQLEEQVGRPDAPTTQATESTSVDGNMRSWQGSAIHEWDKRLREARASGMSRDKAVRSVALADQDLHKAYLDEFNLSYPRKG